MTKRGPWDYPEEQAFLALRKAGKTHAEAGAVIGRSEDACNRRVFHINIWGEIPPPGPPPKTRKCLTCEKPFASDWAGNRVCGACQETDVWRSGAVA